MPEGTATTTEPTLAVGWFAGWTYTLATGSTVGTASSITVEAARLLWAWRHSRLYWVVGLNEFIWLLTILWELSLLVSAVPLTICYILLRCAPATVRITLLRRIALGAAVGLVIDTVLLIANGAATAQPAQVLRPAGFAYPDIVVGAVATALVLPGRWFRHA